MQKLSASRAAVMTACLAARSLAAAAEPRPGVSAEPMALTAVEDVSSPYRTAPVEVPLPVKRYVAPAPAPVPAPPPARRWEVQMADMTLSRTLERWSSEAGVRLRWDAGRTFEIHAPTTFTGDFEGVVIALLSTPGVRDGDYPLEACLYANTPPLLRVTRRGEQASACEPVDGLATAPSRPR